MLVRHLSFLIQPQLQCTFSPVSDCSLHSSPSLFPVLLAMSSTQSYSSATYTTTVAESTPAGGYSATTTTHADSNAPQPVSQTTIRATDPSMLPAGTQQSTHTLQGGEQQKKIQQ